MPLTDIAARSAKPREKPYKVADERGLFLLVKPSGGRLWRFKYRFGGKEKKLALGVYPDVGLKQARERRDHARQLLAEGLDPGVERKRQQLSRMAAAESSFDAIGKELIAKMRREGKAEATITKSEWLLSLLKKSIGSLPVAEITPQELLAALRLTEARGRLETARRLKNFAGRVFLYAVATSRAAANPAILLVGALTAPIEKHRAAILDPKGVGALLRAIDGYEGQSSTVLALRLAPHVFVRPGELRYAEKPEFDLDQAIWKIPAGKMKMRQPHVVPLSQQAIVIIRQAFSAAGRGSYLFPSARSWQRPISENTINAALRRLGYTSEEMTAHGFRAMASTLLNESGKWSPDAIERALAHKDTDPVRAAYHRGTHWNERVEMAQWWSDHLDALRADSRGSVGNKRPRSKTR
jgi:integrase